MTTKTICDECGEPIDAGAIQIRVDDRWSWPSSNRWRFDAKTPKPPRPISVSLDLHRACYEARYQPTLEPDAAAADTAWDADLEPRRRQKP